MSICIKPACQNFTSSRETSSEMGTKFVKMRIHVPASYKKSKSHSVSHLLCSLNLRYCDLPKLLTVHVAPMNAPTDANKTCKIKIIAMFLFV
jgi:hypothetical protein